MPNVNWTWLIVGLALGFVVSGYLAKRRTNA